MNGKFKANVKTVVRTYTYNNGSQYIGEWKGGFRHGKGKMTWQDGAIYEGEW